MRPLHGAVTSGRLGDLLRWLPAVTAAAYLATVALMFRGLVRALYWDTDAAAPLVLAERLRGDGAVAIPHFGVWTSLWYLLATRSLPGHARLWESTGYALAVGAAVVVAWATARVAGRWAGVTAGATALIVGPVALRSLLTLNYHVTTPFTAGVLGAYVVVLTHRRSWIVAVAVGLIAGANAASDPLLWVAGIAPFAIAAALLVATARRGDIALRAGVALGVTVLTAVSANELMQRLGFDVVGLELRLASVRDLPGHVLLLGKTVAFLGGANYVAPGGYPREPVRLLTALLVLVAVSTPVVCAAKHLLRRSEPALRAYACYWGAATVLLCASFVGTTNAADLGPGSVNYTLTLALAAGVGIALLAGGSFRAQWAIGLAVATVGVVNIAGIAQGRADTSLGAIGTYQRPLTRLLEREGVTRGYAGYWDAQNLTWQSGMRLRVAPVSECGSQLCAYRWFTIDSWFDDRPGPSFLIVDPTTRFVTQPPPLVKHASAVHRIGPLRVYVFRYDIARHLRSD